MFTLHYYYQLGLLNVESWGGDWNKIQGGGSEGAVKTRGGGGVLKIEIGWNGGREIFPVPPSDDLKWNSP